jgi:hypothetical protein
MEISASPAAVASTIVRKMLSRGFLVSMTRSGSREFVLNQSGDDIALDVDVSPSETAGLSVVVMRGKEVAGSPVMGELQEFIEHRFPPRI